MKNLISSIILIFLLTSTVFANEKNNIDNYDIQQYKGHLGQWIELKSRNMLRVYKSRFDVTIKKIYFVNKKISVGSYIFIPFSEKYLQKLKKENIKRSVVVNSVNEFIWPVEGIKYITSSFGKRRGGFHTGVDLPSRKGTPIVASMDGIVVSRGYSGGYGNSIFIESRNNFFTRYSHNSVILVNKGDFVKKGQIIAFVGSTGNSTGNHLHFEIRYKDIPLNPLDFLPVKKDLQFKYLKKQH